MKTRWETWLDILNVLVLIGLIPWGTWVTREVMLCGAFRAPGPRLVQKDLDNLKTEMREWTLVNVSEKLNRVNENVLEVRLLLQAHLNENRRAAPPP